MKDNKSPIETQPKKRGRKPKLVDPDTTTVEPKKRGRKPKEKVIYTVNKDIPLSIESFSIDNDLLHLNKIHTNNFSNKSSVDSHNIKDFEPYNNNEDNSSFHFINDDKLTKNVIQPIEKTSEKQKYELIPTIYSDINNWPKQTDVHCWWCSYDFDTYPIPCPVKLKTIFIKDTSGKVISTEQNMQVKGCFCSFNCVKAYCLDSNLTNSLDLIPYLFKKMNKNHTKNNRDWINIKKAPNKYLLKIFGGPLSITEFRKNFHDGSRFELLPYPMISRMDKIESFNTKVIKSKNNNISHDIENRLNLKRKKPLPSSKNTLENLMSIHIS